MTPFSKIPKNTFVLPTSIDNTLMSFWSVEQQNQYFMLQKYQEPKNTVFKSVFSTITNLFDAKQSPYRILFQREPNAACLQIAISDTEDTIEAAWDWIKINMVPELEEMESPFEKEEWIVKQMSNIISATIADNDTDDLLHDDTIRNASRTFRQIFDVPSSERLVNYYSCACNSRQGWMYISENYLGFYSYLLGFELKILIELKEVKSIINEPIRKLFRHSMRIVTKSEQEYLFTNMFKRYEVYELLVQLTGDSIHRLLKNTNSSAFKSDSFGQLTISDRSMDNDEMSTYRPSDLTAPKDSLRNVLQLRKRNENFRRLFSIPDEEEIMDSINVCYMFGAEESSRNKQDHTIQRTQYPGTLYQTQNFLVFEASETLPATEHQKSICTFILPLYTITRFERINNDTYRSALSFTTWHKMTHVLKVDAEKTACEQFCDILKEGLNKNVTKMKTSLRPFLMTCKSEEILETPEGPIYIQDAIGGLGLQFGYRSDATEVKDEKKLRIWTRYFQDNGRNLTLVRQPIFGKMVRAGLPNALRGEVWEMCSGSIYLRFANKGVYQQILDSHKDVDSFVKDEIEKDLHRSLPEYEAYQTSEGISRLRRVLTAYSWKNTELGYCQAMNIVTSSLLIYMTEEQAFWALNSLVDHLCPGYYSSSMYGVLLDQVVLEELVKKYMPKLTEHFQERQIQLSVACLPWFLTLYINSMPLPFAFRILDCFFLEGSKILFQIALAILKINEKELLTVDDDSELLVIAKEFFKALNMPMDDTATEQHHTKPSDIFNNLMKSAYTDFNKVTSDQITELRRQNELRVIGGVETFTKRNALRNVKNTVYFSNDEISIIYDYFSSALYYANNQGKSIVPEMDLKAFTKMLESMTTWAKFNNQNSNNTSSVIAGNSSDSMRIAQAILQSFIRRLFENFRAEGRTGITLVDTVTKLGEILRGDIMSKAAFFFALYDKDKKDILTNQELYSMASEFHLILCLLEIPHPLDTIANFICLSAEQTNTPKAMEHLHQQLDVFDRDDIGSESGELDMKRVFEFTNDFHQVLMGTEAPMIEITLPMFRMIVLTEESLDQFIQTDFPQSFKLQKSLVERQKGLGHEIFEALLVEGKKFASNMTAAGQQDKLSVSNTKNRSMLTCSRSPKSVKSTISNFEDDDYELI